MEITNLLYASLSLGSLGLVFGIGLGYASKKFAIEEDSRVGLVRAVLPSANCGACGYPGCDACATAIVSGEAAFDACTVGGPKVSKLVAEVLGVEVGQIEEVPGTTAFVKCSGSSLGRKSRYDFKEIAKCCEAAATQVTEGGDCSFGCLGLGCCTRVCKFGAISIIDGVAVVDEAKCTCCGACVKACPKGIIDIVPVDKGVRVACSTHEKGKLVKDACAVGCIGCTLCVKACEFGAIIFENNLARVDYEKCTQCKACAKKCPTKSIQVYFDVEAATAKP